MGILYDGAGNTIEIPVPENNVISLGKNVAKKRTNIVHTATVSETTGTYFQAGLLLKNTGGVSTATFNWSIEITGTATSIVLFLGNSPGTTHTYETGGGEQSFSDTFNIPEGTFALWPNLVTTDGDSKNATSRILKIASLPEGISLIGTDMRWSHDLSVNTLSFDEETKYYPYYNCKWNQQEYVAFGDSITQGVAPYYVSIVGEKLQCLSTINKGRGGSSMTDLAGTIVADMESVAKPQLITLAHGVNGNQSLGTIEPHGSTFDVNTFIGATQYVIEAMQRNSPNSTIVIITPIASGGASTQNTETTGRRKALHDVAESYGLACISGTEIISDKNKSQYLQNDTLHPNAAGQLHYGEVLAEILAGL